MGIADDPLVRELIALAKAEDVGTGDVTTALLADPAADASFHLVARSPGVFAGREVAEAILAAFDPGIRVEWTAATTDGNSLDPAPAILALVRGPLGSILSAERTFLNSLQRLCAVATHTRKFVDAVAGTGAEIYDTRKTIPGWRVLDKYAVRCGGGRNHRAGLHDAVLIKDNHLTGVPPTRLAGVVFDMLNRLRTPSSDAMTVEVEASSLEQFEELLKIVGIDIILLDNFSIPQLRDAVARRDELGLRGKVALEASGGVTLANVRKIAETGVERISVGALTHSAPAVDLALDRI